MPPNRTNTAELSDAEVFGATELTDAEVFGAELSDADVGISATVGTIRGQVAAFGRGIKTARAIPEVIAAAQTRKNDEPTMRQERQAFESAMTDPNYTWRMAEAATPRAARKVESVFGPTAKLDMAMAPQRAERKAIIQDLAQSQAEIAASPRSEAQQRLAAAPSQSEKWRAWLRDPVELTASIALESLPPSITGAVAGAPLGPGGVALGAGSASALMTLSSELLGNADKLGYDISDPTQLDRFLRNERDFQSAFQPAVTKASIVGSVDAATAGAAGKFIGPALAQGLKRRVFASGQELVMQAAGGAGGELAGQVATGQPLDWFDVAMEAAAEVASGPAEVISNLRGERTTREPGFYDPDRPPIIPPPDNELPAPEPPAPPSPPIQPEEAETETKASVVGEQPPPVAASSTPTPAAPDPANPAPPVSPATPTAATPRSPRSARPDPEASTDRPPDILDWISNHYPGGIRPTSLTDFGDYVSAFAGVLKPARIAARTGAKRSFARIERLLHPTQGEAADRALQNAHAQGEFLNIQTEDDFLAAMLDAAKTRVNAKAAASEEAKIISREELDRQDFERVAFGSKRLGAQPQPVSGLFVGDQFRLGDKPVRVVDWQIDAETGQPSGVVLDGAFGRQFVPASASLSIDHNSLKSPDPVDAFLTKAIAATDFTGVQVMEGILGAPVWITKGTLNAVLRVVRAAYRGSKSLAKAIQAGLDWLRAQNLPDYNEAEARDFLERNLSATADDPDVNAREFADQLDASGPVETAESTVNRLYQRRTNESDAAFAARIIDTIGSPEAAIAVFTDTANGLPGAVRMFLGQLIVKQLSAAGKHELAAAFLDDHFLPSTTDIAQSLQALAAWMHLSPAGMVVWAKRKIAKAASEITARLEPAIDAASAAIDAINRDGIERTVNAPDVQRNAREAIDDALELQADTFGSPLAKAILDKALSELVAAGLITAREAEILKLHLDSDPSSGTLAQKLTSAGIPNGEARQKAIETAYKAARTRTRSTIRRRASAARKSTGATQAPTTDPLDAAIAKAIADLRINLGKLIRAHFTQADAAGVSLAEHLQQAANLPPEAAAQLANAVLRRFAAIVQERKTRELEKLLKPVPARTRKPLLTRLIELSNLGALSQQQTWDAVRSRLDLPAWSPELAQRLTAMAHRLQRIPENQLEARQRATVAFLNEIERAKGVTALDLGLAFYITNILTGITTHAKNLISTTLNAISAVTAEHLRAVSSGRLDDIPIMWAALARGSKLGGIAALDILRTGQVTGSRLTKLEAGRPLELAQFGRRGGVQTRGRLSKAVLENPIASFLNLWKYNYRLMGAEDMLLFKPAEEMKAAILAKRIARTEGLRGIAAHTRAKAILGYGIEAVLAAEAQAATEGYTGPAARRRTAEILHLARPDSLRHDALEFALRTTFNNKPYGLLGAIAGLINRAKSSDNAKLRIGATLVTPFTNIIANVVNESLNFTPIGAVRAALASKDILGQDSARLTPDQVADLKAELYAKATLGTLMLGAVALKAASHIDDDDPPFAVYGAGPLDPADRKGWLAAGGLAHSVKIKDRYYSFATTPAAIPLAALGNLFDRLRDARKYNNGGAKRAMDSLPMAFAVSVLGAAKVITEQSFLVGLMDLSKLASERQPEYAGRTAWRTATRTASSFVVPNAVRQVDRIMDPTVYESNDIESILASAVPFVRSLDGRRPALNALGQPITVPLSAQFTRQATGDQLVRVLNERGVFPDLPDRNHVWPRAGRAMSDDEFYRYVLASGRAIYHQLERERRNGNLRRFDARTTTKLVSTITEKTRENERAKMGF